MPQITPGNTQSFALVCLATLCFSSTSGAQEGSKPAQPSTGDPSVPELNDARLPGIGDISIGVVLPLSQPSDAPLVSDQVGSRSVALGTNIPSLSSGSYIDRRLEHRLRQLEIAYEHSSADDVSAIGYRSGETSVMLLDAHIERLQKNLSDEREAQESREHWLALATIASLALSIVATIKSFYRPARRVIAEVILSRRSDNCGERSSQD